MRVALVVQDGCFASSVSSILDIVHTAELIRHEIDVAIPRLEIVVAASGRRVALTGGMAVAPTRTLRELDGFDVVVLPALGTITGPDTEAALESRAVRAVVRALENVDTQRSRLAAACTGVFPLAETGLLAGRRVTTTWFLTPLFRARYPSVSVDLDRMVVDDGPILTAGAAFAHIDLALALLRGVSVELARQVARLLLIDDRPSQTGYVTLDHLEHDDAIVRAFERHVRDNLDQAFDVTHTARVIGTSRRTLERRTRQILGLTPLGLVQRLRIERASHLRRTTDLSTVAIAQRVGYVHGETLRALEKRAPGPTGRSPSGKLCDGRPYLNDTRL